MVQMVASSFSWAFRPDLFVRIGYLDWLSSGNADNGDQSLEEALVETLRMILVLPLRIGIVNDHEVR